MSDNCFEQLWVVIISKEKAGYGYICAKNFVKMNFVKFRGKKSKMEYIKKEMLKDSI